MTTAATRAADRAAAGDGLDALSLTLAPVAPEAFLDEHWEREPLVVSRGEPGRFDGILSPADVERLICTTGMRAPAFRLVRDGGQINLGEYTEDIPWRPGSFSRTAVVERVAQEFERGATLVLQGLHHHWHPAARFCRELEMYLECPVQANAYHTPASAQGFAVHHDTHDVFVMQVAGRKRWRIYEPLLELPLKSQRWSSQRGEVGEPALDFVLEGGDTLYLPRGWPHEAATSDTDSLHLTVGLHPPSRLDALRATLESCGDDVEFRRSVARDGTLPGHLLERLAERLEPAAVQRRMRRRFVAGRRPILDGQLAQVAAVGNLGPHDELERRATVIAHLEVTPTGATLLFERKELRFPAQATAAVEAIYHAAAPFSAAELPGRLDGDGRLVLVRRLVREGFVRIRGI